MPTSAKKVYHRCSLDIGELGVLTFIIRIDLMKSLVTNKYTVKKLHFV